MYHSVSDVSERDKKIRSTNPAYSLTVGQFREQMECIRKNEYKTIHLNQLLGSNTEVPQKSLVITFDDGWTDNYTNVLPILKEYGLTATIFVITGTIGQSNYMDWNQLRDMSKAGISIQSHTVSHKPLAGLTDHQLMYELTDSKQSIEDHLGRPVYFLSLPHGVFNNRIRRKVYAAGYKAVCTSEPGFSHTYKDLPVLKRINISDSYEIETFKKIVGKNQMALLPLIISKKIKNLLRKIVGYDTYRSIYNLRYLIKN